MNTPLVSFVVPCYNYGRYLRECLDSIFNQRGCDDFEIIAINDCSPDERMSPVLQQLAAQHPEISLHTNEQNLGFVQTVNRGIFLRQRDVVLLNSDARVTPG